MRIEVYVYAQWLHLNAYQVAFDLSGPNINAAFTGKRVRTIICFILLNADQCCVKKHGWKFCSVRGFIWIRHFVNSYEIIAFKIRILS